MSDIVLDLPVPPSVNKTRRVNWEGRAQHGHWRKMADAMILGARCRSIDPIKLEPIKGQFEATVILSEKHTKIDLDNGLKALLDYAVRIELVEDDSPKYLRRLVMEWGLAPQGCRLILRPFVSHETGGSQ